MNFTSDNVTGAAPQIMEALLAANAGCAPGYGGDDLTAQAEAQIRRVFEAPEARAFFVTTGTAANALACATLTDPWGAVFCHSHAHIAEDECGAPEFYTAGAKLTLIAGEHGRMDPDTLARTIGSTGAVGVHGVQPGMVSLTNTTESGTTYSAAQTREICAIARAHGLPVHLDGARFANAVAATGASPADLSWRAGVDILSFGGTKNGCMGVEAVVIFDPARAREFELRRKRGGHLLSKNRFLAAQMAAYLSDDLWLDLARHANAMAARLSAGIMTLPGASLTHPTEANAVFAAFPRAAHRRAEAAGAQYYLWPADQTLDGAAETPASCRLVTSWCTSEAEVDAFLAALA